MIITSSHAPSFNLVFLMKALILVPVHFMARWWRRREAVRHLGELPDYLLRDLGLERDNLAVIRNRAAAEVARQRAGGN